MAVTWIKHKYRTPKRTSPYRSSHNDSNKKSKKIGGKLNTENKSTHVRILVIDANTGKRHWKWMNKE